MAENELDPNQEELDEAGQGEQTPQEPGVARSVANAAGREAVRRGAASLAARGGVAVGAQAAGAAAGGPVGIVAARAATALSSPILPGILLLILALLTLGAILMVGFAICVSNGCMGTRAFDAKLDPATSVLDRNHLADIQCLDAENRQQKNTGKAAGGKTPATDENEPLTAECVKAIKNWTDYLKKNTEALQGKLTTAAEDQEAKKLLDEVLAANTAAAGVSTQTTFKQARILRADLLEKLEKANENERIRKLTAFSPNAQKIVDYVTNQGAAFCTQKDPTGCSRQASAILRGAFPGSAPTAGASLGNRITGAPDAADLQKARDALSNGSIPLWLIRGNGSGQHWIIVLKIDSADTVTYFDPADGTIHSDPSNASSVHTYFFGSPTDDKLSGNIDERGYIFQP